MPSESLPAGISAVTERLAVSMTVMWPLDPDQLTYKRDPSGLTTSCPIPASVGVTVIVPRTALEDVSMMLASTPLTEEPATYIRVPSGLKPMVLAMKLSGIDPVIELLAASTT